MATGLSFSDVNNSPDPLRQRLQALGIPSWRAWQQQAGVSRRVIAKARQGLWADLKWGEIQRLATSLAWDPGTLLECSGYAGGEAAAALKAEIHHLRTALQHCQEHTQKAAHRTTFEQLRSLLISFPTARALAHRDPSRPAQSLVALFSPLETWLQQQGITCIGQPFQTLPYNPIEHQCDQGGVNPGDPVEIRFVGYRQGPDILVPARVIPVVPGCTVEG